MKNLALIPLLGLIMAACLAGSDHATNTSDNPPASPAQGTLAGNVVMGPLSPAVRPGNTATPPGVADAQITISSAGGGAPLTAITDANGHYSIALPPGTYTITMASLHGAMFTRDLPGTVTVVSHQETRFDIHLDTGIR